MHKDMPIEHSSAMPIGRPLQALLPSAGAMMALVLMLFGILFIV